MLTDTRLIINGEVAINFVVEETAAGTVGRRSLLWTFRGRAVGLMTAASSVEFVVKRELERRFLAPTSFLTALFSWHTLLLLMNPLSCRALARSVPRVRKSTQITPQAFTRRLATAADSAQKVSILPQSTLLDN